DPGSFSVHAEAPFTSLAQLVAHAKANPGAVTVGSSGHGTSGHMTLLLFERAAGVKMNHVPYKGSGDSRTALAGRQIEVAAIERAAADPEFVTKSLQYYAPLRYLPSAQFEAELRAADTQFRQLWKETPWAEK